MSQADPSAEIQVLSDLYLVNTALLIYDTLLTLPSEIKHIWCKTVKIGTILYVFSHYLLMAFFVLAIYGSLSNLAVEVYYDNTLMKCNTITRLVHALQVPLVIGVQGLLLARTYAISLQNQKVLGVLGLLILSPTIINVVCPCADFVTCLFWTIAISLVRKLIH
ncbi:hypothetical protein JB92DRAFT_2903042 [Gautieria morchelliformis]|nr:hypothetical protein JB92DRAFT_2903042 [Gautieria morchelliformis]